MSDRVAIVDVERTMLMKRQRHEEEMRALSDKRQRLLEVAKQQLRQAFFDRFSSLEARVEQLEAKIAEFIQKPASEDQIDHANDDIVWAPGTVLEAEMSGEYKEYEGVIHLVEVVRAVPPNLYECRLLAFDENDKMSYDSWYESELHEPRQPDNTKEFRPGDKVHVQMMRGMLDGGHKVWVKGTISFCQNDTFYYVKYPHWDGKNSVSIMKTQPFSRDDIREAYQ